MTILQRLEALHDGKFLKSSCFLNIWCFFKGFLSHNKSKSLVESSLSFFFLEFYFLTSSDDFAKAIGFA